MTRFLFVILAGCVLAASAFGQTAKTRATLYSDADSALADTGEDPITPADVRGLLKDVIASSYNALTDGTPGTGTVTSVSLALPNIFAVSGSPVTTSGTLTGSLATQTANTVFTGPTTGGAAAPTFRALVAADIPSLASLYASFAQGALADTAVQPGDLATVATTGAYSDLSGRPTLATVATSGAYSDLSGLPTIPSAIYSTIAVSGQSDLVADSATDTLTLAAGSNITLTTNAGTDTITIASTGGFSNPMTTAEDLIVGGTGGAPERLAVGTEGQVLKVVSGAVAWGTDSTGTGGLPGTPAEGDLTYYDGADWVSLPIGTAGQVLKVNGTADAPEWAAAGGTGTVTSVALSGTDGLQVDSGSPITTSGTIQLGVDAAALRAHLNVADGATANTGTVTSVALALPNIFSVSGSPVTGSGTLTGSLATQTANLIFAGPTTGGAAAPTFRALVAADIPSLTSLYATFAQGALADTALQPAAIGSTVQAFDADLGALAGLSTSGLLARTGAGTAAARTLTGTSNRITVTNGDGVSGNPTIDIASTYVGQTSITTLGTITTGTFPYANLSGAPTIPSAIFSTIAVSGQSDVVADTATDTLTLAAGSNITITTNAGTDTITIAATGGGSGGTKTYAVFSPTENQPPATNFATLDTRNSITVLDFDDTTEESAIFASIMPEAASLGSGLSIRIIWTATSATTGACRWGVALERGTTDLDADSFDTAAETTTTTNGTSGIPTTTTITLTTIDSVTAGDFYRLKVYRDTGDAADTMTGDAEILAVEVRSGA